MTLTAKPHAFAGAVLSPKHARELNPGLCMGIASALSSDSSRISIVPYTVWITEAWKVLGWGEPSAALFWEMATMYHTLYVAGRIETDDQIPPILSCGSHSSMGSVAPEQKSQRQKYSSTAKELPVWLIGTFLLLHCEDSTHRAVSKTETDPSVINSPPWQSHKQMSTRLRSQAGQQDHYTCFLLRHLRKFLLLLAIPNNDDAVRACIHLAALPPSHTSMVSDVSLVEKWHAEEHGSVGVGIRLTMDDLEKLHFVLHIPSGGPIEDPPIDIGKHLWKSLYRSSTIPSHATIALGDVERALRQQLMEGYQKHLRPETAMAKLSLSAHDKFSSSSKYESYCKEISYNGLRGRTIFLTPESLETERLNDLVITDCHECHFYLLRPFEHVTMSFVSGCTIVVGAVAGLLYVMECEKTQMTTAARRLLISNSLDLLAHIFTPSPPLLVGDNRNCQLAPYNSYYEGLREDLLATGLAAAILNESPPSPTPGVGTAWPLQCASNKWKQPVELAKLELPHVDEDASKSSTDDAAMQTPILLSASEFQILFVPFVAENQDSNEPEEVSEPVMSQYCQILAKILQHSPFRLPVEYERQALAKADRMLALQKLLQSLTAEQQSKLEDELNRGFRDWLVTSGNLRQVLDLVHLEERANA